MIAKKRCIIKGSCHYPKGKNEKCDIHIGLDIWHKCVFLKEISENGNPVCFRTYNDGFYLIRGQTICMDCDFKTKCEKETPQKEREKIEVFSEQAFRTELENKRNLAIRDFEQYMDSY